MAMFDLKKKIICDIHKLVEILWCIEKYFCVSGGIISEFIYYLILSKDVLQVTPFLINQTAGSSI